MNLNVKNLGQVWTPEWLISLVLDKAGYYGSGILTKTILEPSFGAGVFIKEIVKRLISEGLKQKYTPKELTKIIDESVYGIEYDEKCFTATKTELINWIEQTYGINVKLPNLHKMDALDYSNFSFFDYVVGNPPYIRIHNLPDDMREKVKQYSLSTGTTDLYIIFYELGLKWLNKEGVLSYIAPNSWLKNSSQKNMREKLVNDNNIKEIIDFGTVNVFPKISTYTCITILDKKHNNEITFSKMNNTTKPDFIVKIPYSFLNKNKGKPFSFVSDSDYTFLKKKTSLQKLDDIAKVQNGIATLGDKYFIIKDGMKIEEEYITPIVKASTFKGNEYQKIIFPYLKKDNKYVGIAEDVLDTVPLLKTYLLSEKENLSKRSLDKNSLWFWYGRSQAIQETDKRKLVFSPIISPTQKKIKSYILPSGTLVYSGLFITEKPSGLSLEKIQKIIETEEFTKYIRLLGKDMSGKYKSVNSNIVKNYPI